MVNPNSYSAVQKNEGMTTIRFDNFAGLPLERNVCYDSHNFSSLGHDWSLALYPGGLE